MSDSQNPSCPTYEQMLGQLALPPGLLDLLDAPLKQLGLPLQQVSGDDEIFNVFSYYRADSRQGALAFIYVANMQDKNCASVVQNLGPLFFGKAHRLFIFSEAGFIFPGYTRLAEKWKKMGLAAKIFSSYETGMLGQVKQTNPNAIVEKIVDYLSLEDLFNGGGPPKPHPPATTPLPPVAQPPPKVKIFVSYSHLDSRYLDRGELLDLLKGIEHTEFWTDRAIIGGEDWDDVIQDNIRQAHIALVLVSQFFLDSGYVKSSELPQFLEQAEREGLIIFPVMLSACEWDLHDWLKSRQYLPKEGRNIEQHYTAEGERRALYVEIRRQLRAQITAARQKLLQADG
ncbi:MAG: toll/interleukin-1 receptor domain-containing protein [Pyrinomonadaceae bacterium]